MAGEGGRRREKKERERERGRKKVREREGEEKDQNVNKHTVFEVLPFSTIILKLRVIGP